MRITLKYNHNSTSLVHLWLNIRVCKHRVAGMHTSILFCEAGDSKGIKNPHLSGTLPTPVLPLCFCEQSTWIPSLGPAAPLISRTWMPCLAMIRGLEITLFSLISTLALLDCSHCHVLLGPLCLPRAVSLVASHQQIKSHILASQIWT